MCKIQLYKNTGRGIYIGAIDAITKAYIRKNEVFADAFNYFMYDGAQVIQPERLKELDSTEIAILLNEKEIKDKKAVQVEAQQKYRDILKSAAIMEDGHTAYILLGIENQTDVNYAMPVRNMLYDALQYTKQVSEIADVHRRKKENSSHKSVSHAEFISGFYKSDRLIPVITLVIYFNAGEWDGPRSLLDMMEIPDPIVRRYAQDYQIHLINPNQIADEELEKFQSSLREVMGCIKYSRSKEKLAAFINNNPRMNMEAAAARVIERIVDSVPVSRNENIAEFMHKCGICEERGSGYDKIVEVTGKNELLVPRIENKNNQFTKAVLFTKVPFDLTTKEDRIRTCYMQACLACVNFEGISNADIRKIFGLK